MTLRTRTYHSMAQSLNALEIMTKRLNDSMFFEVGPDGQGTARRPVRPSRRSNAANRHEPVSDGHSRNGLSKYDNMTEDDLYRSVWPLLHGQVMAPTDGFMHRSGSFQKSPNIDTYLEYLNKSFGHQSSRALKVMAQRAGIVLIKGAYEEALANLSGETAMPKPAVVPKPARVSAGDIDARMRPSTGGGNGSVPPAAAPAGANPAAAAMRPGGAAEQPVVSPASRPANTVRPSVSPTPVQATVAAAARPASPVVGPVSAKAGAQAKPLPQAIIDGGKGPAANVTSTQQLLNAYSQFHTGVGRQAIANAARDAGLDYYEQSGVHHVGEQDHMSFSGAVFNAGKLARAGFLQRFESPNSLRFRDKTHEDEWMQAHDLDNTRQSNMIRTNDGFAVVKVAHPTKKGESMLFAYNPTARSWVPVSGIEHNPRSRARGGNGTTIRHWGDVTTSGDYVRHVASTLNTLLGSSEKFNDYNTLTPNLANKATREATHAGMPGNNARHDASIKVSSGQFTNDLLDHSQSAWSGLQQKGGANFELPAEEREGEDQLAEEGAPEQAAEQGAERAAEPEAEEAADTETKLLPPVGSGRPPVGLDDPNATRRLTPEELERRRVDPSRGDVGADATQQLTPEQHFANNQLAAVKNFVANHPHIAQNYNWHAQEADDLLKRLQNNPSDPNAIRDANRLFNTMEMARHSHYNQYKRLLSEKGLDQASIQALHEKFANQDINPEERRQMWENASNRQDSLGATDTSVDGVADPNIQTQLQDMGFTEFPDASQYVEMLRSVGLKDDSSDYSISDLVDTYLNDSPQDKINTLLKLQNHWQQRRPSGQAVSGEERQGLLGGLADADSSSSPGSDVRFPSMPDRFKTRTSYNPNARFQVTPENLEAAKTTIDDLYDEHRGRPFPQALFGKREEMLRGLENGTFPTIGDAYNTVMGLRGGFFSRPGPGRGFFGRSMSVNETDEYIAKMMNRMYGYGVSQSINNIRKSHGR